MRYKALDANDTVEVLIKEEHLLSPVTQWPTSPSFPIAVAKELLNIVSQLPRPAIEAHGLGMVSCPSTYM